MLMEQFILLIGGYSCILIELFMKGVNIIFIMLDTLKVNEYTLFQTKAA